jgi:hypothetical protein
MVMLEPDSGMTLRAALVALVAAAVFIGGLSAVFTPRWRRKR